MFESSPMTLAKASYFNVLLDGRFKKEEEHFVDRSPELFQHILQYLDPHFRFLASYFRSHCLARVYDKPRFLRTGAPPPHSYVEMYRTQLLLECSFFGVDHLADKLRGGTSVWDLRYCDRVLKLGAGELIDVFAVDIVERPPYELELPLLAWDCQDRPSITCGAQGFVGRIRSQLRGCLEDLLPIPGLVIAGGAVTAALTGQRSNDIDIFLIGDPSDAE